MGLLPDRPYPYTPKKVSPASAVTTCQPNLMFAAQPGLVWVLQLLSMACFVFKLPLPSLGRLSLAMTRHSFSYTTFANARGLQP